MHKKFKKIKILHSWQTDYLVLVLDV